MNDIVKQFKEEVELFDNVVKEVGWEEYKSKYFTESSLARVWQHMENPETAVGVISAYRKERSPKTNQWNTKKLKNDASNAGLGFIMLTGYWVETNPETGEKSKVKEESIMVIGDDEKKLDKFLRSQAEQYEQEAYLLKPVGQNHIFLVQGGERIDIGTAKLDKLGEMYSTLTKGSHAGRPFVFESALVQKSFAAILGEKKKA